MEMVAKNTPYIVIYVLWKTQTKNTLIPGIAAPSLPINYRNRRLVLAGGYKKPP